MLFVNPTPIGCGHRIWDPPLEQYSEVHSPNSGAEEEREEVGDDERVDDLLRVGRPLLAAEARLAGGGVEGPAGVVGAQLARRRRFATSDNVGKLPLSVGGEMKL